MAFTNLTTHKIVENCNSSSSEKLHIASTIVQRTYTRIHTLIQKHEFVKKSFCVFSTIVIINSFPKYAFSIASRTNQQRIQSRWYFRKSKIRWARRRGVTEDTKSWNTYIRNDYRNAKVVTFFSSTFYQWNVIRRLL